MVIALLPYPASAIAVLVIVAFLMSLFFPKIVAVSLAVFLPFQRLLALQFYEDLPFLALVVKRAEEAVILIVFVAIVLRRIFYGKKWPRTGIELPLIILLIIAVISTLRSELVSYELAAFDMFLLLKGFLVFYIFFLLDFTDKNIRYICGIFFAIAGIIFLAGLVDLAAPVFFRNFINTTTYIDYRFGIPSVQSIFIHPGMFGWFMAFFACFSYAFFTVFEKNKYLVFMILFALGVMLSMRFKPMGGLAIAVLAAFILTASHKKVKFFFILSGIGLLFVILLGNKIQLLFEDKLYTYIKNPAIYNIARNALYTTSFRIAADYFPFGAGFATFGGWIARIYYSPLYYDYGISFVWGLEEGGLFLNDTFWPVIIGQFGFFGLICYMWILVSFFRRTAKLFRETTDLFIKAFVLGVILVLAEGTVEAMADPVFLSPPQYFFIFSSLGIVYSLWAKKKAVDETLAKERAGGEFKISNESTPGK
jgi:hypothetical protein